MISFSPTLISLLWDSDLSKTRAKLLLLRLPRLSKSSHTLLRRSRSLLQKKKRSKLPTVDNQPQMKKAKTTEKSSRDSKNNWLVFKPRLPKTNLLQPILKRMMTPISTSTSSMQVQTWELPTMWSPIVTDKRQRWLLVRLSQLLQQPQQWSLVQ